jgi:tRNA(Ile)-lysidine synthase TilS/MesJ
MLEAEAVHVMRETVAEFERPVLLFSGGKDSIVLLRLAEKAFRPAPFPFPLMHVDTGLCVGRPSMTDTKAGHGKTAKVRYGARPCVLLEPP